MDLRYKRELGPGEGKNLRPNRSVHCKMTTIRSKLKIGFSMLEEQEVAIVGPVRVEEHLWTLKGEKTNQQQQRTWRLDT